MRAATAWCRRTCMSRSRARARRWSSSATVCGDIRASSSGWGWADAGYVVAAPAFPHTNDENPPPYLIEDVVNQPADISFGLDELLARGLGDGNRVGVGGYSLGAETALAVGLHPRYADPRVRAVG